MKHSKIATRLGAGAAVAAAAIAVGGTPSQAAPSPATAMSGPSAYPTGTVITTSGLNARKAPTRYSAKVGAYQPGATVELYCHAPGGGAGNGAVWYSTNAHGTRWVPAGFIQAHGAVPKCPLEATELAKAVTTTRLNLRSGPSTADLVMTTSPSGSAVIARCKVRAQNIDGNDLWYLLQNDTWASARYLKNVNGGPASNFTPVWCR